MDERLRSNGAKTFKGVAGTTATVAEYWMESIELMEDSRGSRLYFGAKVEGYSVLT